MNQPVMSIAAMGSRIVRGPADDLARQLIDDSALPQLVKNQLHAQSPIGSVAWNHSRQVKVPQSGAAEWWNGPKYTTATTFAESDVRFRPSLAVSGSLDDALDAAWDLHQTQRDVPQGVLNAGTADSWLVGRLGNEQILGDSPFSDLSGFFAGRREVTAHLDEFQAVVDRGQVIRPAH